MAIVGRLHPLLVHFPIALVVLAVMAETVAYSRDDRRWRFIATTTLRIAAGFGLVTALTGWQLAGPADGTTGLLEWHRWLGVTAAGTIVAAALATLVADNGSALGTWTYRVALLAAMTLVAATAHLGGLMVWGIDFLRS